MGKRVFWIALCVWFVFLAVLAIEIYNTAMGLPLKFPWYIGTTAFIGGVVDTIVLT
ncbi:MAG: hypothetical protein HY001_02615 [Candidatus Portnoybacteria bacterium]|nr:hypothetical protein [Candidatus Portnoybacteria bacterium]